LRIPSGAALPGVAVPTPALSVTVPPVVLTVIVFVALNTGSSEALPIVKPVAGAVSEPALRVKVTGPLIEVTAFKADNAFANEV
jgi:hypothetical protein